MEDSMNRFVRLFFKVWCVAALVAFCLHLSKPGDGLPMRKIGVTMAILAATVIIADIVWERLRRRREGFFVDSLGGAESGTVRYHEAGKTLELYFDRPKHTIYVPTNERWVEMMPGWASGRRDEIVGRIKTFFARGWNYEETDRREFLFGQKQ
jgi:hypothetical protein